MATLRSAFTLCVVAVVLAVIMKVAQKEKLPIIVGGTVAPGFEEALKVFRENFEGEDYEVRESGSAFAAYYKGRQVVNIWGGYADYEAYQPWREDTMPIVFSATKGVAAACMALLVERGLLDYEDRVTQYWPEFGQNGKENITVKMLLNHEAGLIDFSNTPITLDMMKDYDELGRVLAQATPVWEPGTSHGYHGFTFGFYASQLLTRADPKKRTLGQFFQEEIATPFGIEFYIGLPKELNYRVGRYITNKLDFKGVKNMIRMLMIKENRSLFWGMLSGKSKINLVMESSPDLQDMNPFIDPENRAIEVPSAAGIGTAESLARLYGIIANGGQLVGGNNLFSEKLIQGLKEDGTVFALDEVMSIPTRFSYGFFRQPYQDRVMLGHPGAGGNNAYADIDYKLSVAFVSRYASAFGIMDDPRFTTVRDAIYRAIETIEGK